MQLLGRLAKLLTNETVVLSDPADCGTRWAYLFGTSAVVEWRLFHNRSKAIEHHAQTRSGLALSSGFICVERLSAEEARDVDGADEVWCE